MTTSEDTVKAVLSPYAELLGNAVMQAVDSYNSLDPSTKVVHSPRTRSSNINDYIRLCVSQAVPGLSPDIRLKFRYGQLRLIIADKVQLTFKKLNDNFLPTYIPTGRWTEFMEQAKHSVELPDLPDPVTNLCMGYQWEGIGSPKVFLVCPNGRKVEWKLELLPPVVPQPTTEPSPAFAPKHIVPKSKPNKSVTQE